MSQQPPIELAHSSQVSEPASSERFPLHCLSSLLNTHTHTHTFLWLTQLYPALGTCPYLALSQHPHTVSSPNSTGQGEEV